MIRSMILGVMANILRTYTIYKFMEMFYLSKNVKSCWKFIVYTIYVCLTSGGYYIFHNTLLNIFTNILGLFLIILLYYGNLWKNCLIIVCIYCVNIAMESFVFSLIKIGRNSDIILESINECITSIGLLILVIIIEKTRAIKAKDYHMKISLWLALISIPVVSNFIIINLVYKKMYNEKYVQIEILGILLINIVVFYLYGALQDYYRQKVEKETFFYKMKIYGNQLDILKDSNQKMRELRHDMKHHLSELKYLARNGEDKSILIYIDNMEKYMLNTREYIDSGNKDIDGTLNYLLQKAKDKLNQVDVAISIPEGIEIHNYLFNVILGNLLENAIDGATYSEKKYLKISMKTKQNVMFINIVNSFSGEVKLQNNKLLTTKNNEEQHGIGLNSVKRMVDEMNGSINIKWESGYFNVSVMLYMDTI